MKYLIFAVILLPACSFTDMIGLKGAEASDEALRIAIWEVCNASPVGAVKRRFDTPEKAKIWNSLCLADTEFEL